MSLDLINLHRATLKTLNIRRKRLKKLLELKIIVSVARPYYSCFVLGFHCPRWQTRDKIQTIPSKFHTRFGYWHINLDIKRSHAGKVLGFVQVQKWIHCMVEFRQNINSLSYQNTQLQVLFKLSVWFHAMWFTDEMITC